MRFKKVSCLTSFFLSLRYGLAVCAAKSYQMVLFIFSFLLSSFSVSSYERRSLIISLRSFCSPRGVACLLTVESIATIFGRVPFAQCTIGAIKIRHLAHLETLRISNYFLLLCLGVDDPLPQSRAVYPRASCEDARLCTCLDIASILALHLVELPVVSGRTWFLRDLSRIAREDWKIRRACPGASRGEPFVKPASRRPRARLPATFLSFVCQTTPTGSKTCDLAFWRRKIVCARFWRHSRRKVARRLSLAVCVAGEFFEICRYVENVFSVLGRRTAFFGRFD